jgi:hypothetical protein
MLKTNKENKNKLKEYCEIIDFPKSLLCGSLGKTLVNVEFQFVGEWY